jgi:UDP-galactopyranose mutase
MPLHCYTRMFERMLDHPNIKLMLNTDYREIQSIIPFGEMIYTGRIDEFFDLCYGKLPYRSLHFRHEIVDAERYQEAPVINYPNEHPYTRITEFKYLTGQRHPKTAIVSEYPCAEGDPYYPIPRPENAVLYRKYQALAEGTPGVHFVGRLATYKYYNMDQVTAQALTLYDRLVSREGKVLDGLARGGIRPTKSVTIRSVKAKLVPKEELTKHGADGKAAAPPKNTELVMNELQIKGSC